MTPPEHLFIGFSIGNIIYAAGDEEIARVPLLAAKDVEPAGVLRRALDGVTLGVLSLVSRAGDLLGNGAAAMHRTTVVSASRLDPGGQRNP